MVALRSNEKSEGYIVRDYQIGAKQLLIKEI
jgi:hypothetical protein